MVLSIMENCMFFVRYFIYFYWIICFVYFQFDLSCEL